MSTTTDSPSPQTGNEKHVEIREATFAEKMGVGVVFIGIALWALAGIAAVIMSIVCFGYSGTTMEKAIGLAIAFFLGPLYFVFYAVNKSYCRNLGANVSGSVTRLVGGAAKAVEEAI